MTKFKLIDTSKEELPPVDVAEVLSRLSTDYNLDLAICLLKAISSAELLDGTATFENISFECLPSVCKKLSEELRKIQWGQ